MKMTHKLSKESNDKLKKEIESWKPIHIVCRDKVKKFINDARYFIWIVPLVFMMLFNSLGLMKSLDWIILFSIHFLGYFLIFKNILKKEF
jgi:hypothetical protein